MGGRKLPTLEYRVRDVTAHAVGVTTVTDTKEQVNAVILGQGKPMPSDHVAAFALAEPGQTEALIELLEGRDGAPKEQCKPLGHFALAGLKPIHDRPHPIDIRISIDRNGILTAEAYDAISEKRNELVLTDAVAKHPSDAANQKGGA